LKKIIYLTTQQRKRSICAI